MKTMKFREELAKMILAGEKSSTWRLFDNKDLSEGDQIDMLVWETKESFARGVLLSAEEKPLGQLTDHDKVGHEKFASDNEMYETYSQYYDQTVGPDTLVKIIRFKLLES